MRFAPVFAALMTSFAAPPPTPERPVTDRYHGTEVRDPYRWLEDGAAAEVKQWTRAQNAASRAWLDPLPARARLRPQVEKILKGASVRYFALAERPNGLFAAKADPARQQPAIVLLPSPDSLAGERLVLDVDRLDAGGHVSFDWFVPSPDGKLLAVSLSHGGSESGDVHLFDTATGKATGEVVPRVNGGTAGGSLAWSPDGRGFYYTRYPRDGERPAADLAFYQQLWYHPLGSSTDRYEIGRDFPRIAEIEVDVHPDGRVLLTMQRGDSGEFVHWLRGADARWTQITQYADRIVQAVFGPGRDLFCISRREAPRGKILRFDGRQWTTLVPEAADTLESDFGGPPPLVVQSNALYAIYQLGGPSEVRVFGLDGRARPKPALPPLSSVKTLARWKGGVLFESVSYLEPAAWRQHAAGRTRATALVQSSPVSLADCEATREFAVSRDGTKIPVNIIRRKGLALDGSAPALLSGYGGFSLSQSPVYLSALRPLLDAGFVIAIANLRGGNEFGEQWHEQGRLGRKQNVFDDFLAAARHLIARRYTAAARLAIRGGSNGGLLMGAALTQAPELFRAVVAQVGIYDMLRNELTPNGSFNTVEYGTVKEEAHFRAMYAYSPYHRVRDGARYPAVLLMTGENDPRVDPLHSRKMAARLQAATASGLPILLRADPATGHGMGTPLNARIEELVDIYAFLFDQLGVKE